MHGRTTLASLFLGVCAVIGTAACAGSSEPDEQTSRTQSEVTGAQDGTEHDGTGTESSTSHEATDEETHAAPHDSDATDPHASDPVPTDPHSGH